MKNYKWTLFIVLFLWGCGSKNGNNASNVIPDYTLLNFIEMYGGKGKAGYVLMPTASRSMSAKDRETLLREILKNEGWVYVAAFNSKLAYQERNCDPYEKRKPAYKTGFIGVVNQFGQFSD